MINIGILIYPDVEELDFLGPFEVLSYINKVAPVSTNVMLIAEKKDPVRAYNGLRVIPDVTIRSCPPLDILLAPGGRGRLVAMKNPTIINFIKAQNNKVRYMTSVCTGAFLLAESGLLSGKKATTYYTAFAELATYGVEVTAAKVVQDGNIITAGGVSSGLELGFYLLRELFGTDLAQEVAHKIDYAVNVSAL